MCADCRDDWCWCCHISSRTRQNQSKQTSPSSPRLVISIFPPNLTDIESLRICTDWPCHANFTAYRYRPDHLTTSSNSVYRRWNGLLNSLYIHYKDKGSVHYVQHMYTIFVTSVFCIHFFSWNYTVSCFTWLVDSRSSSHDWIPGHIFVLFAILCCSFLLVLSLIILCNRPIVMIVGQIHI